MAENTFKGMKKLEDFSCEVIKSKDDNSEEKHCVLNFKVPIEGSSQKTEEINLHITRPGLNVLIDGLHKIQSQLNNVVNKNKA